MKRVGWLIHLFLKVRENLVEESAKTAVQMFIKAIAWIGFLIIATFTSFPGVLNADGKLWPLSHTATYFIILAVSFVVIMVIHINKCRRSRVIERRKQRVQAQVEQSKEPSPRSLAAKPIPVARNGFMETVTDLKFLKGSASIFAFYLIVVICVGVYSESSFAVEGRIWSSAGVDAEGAMVILMQEGKTVATGLVDADGICQFNRAITRGQVRALICKEVSGKTLWSEVLQFVDREHPKIEISGFPQHNPSSVAIPTMYFKKGSFEILPNAQSQLLEAQNILSKYNVEVIVSGATCDLEYDKESSMNNYKLSLERCKSVVQVLSLVGPNSRYVLAPLSNLFPLNKDSTDETVRGRERRVHLILLLP